MTESVDTTMIEELKMLMEDEFPVLIETYVQDCDHRIQGLESAIASNDSVEIRELAHAFKGSSSNLGAQKLADICFKLESMGRDNQLEQAAMTYDEIKNEYRMVREYYLGLI